MTSSIGLVSEDPSIWITSHCVPPIDHLWLCFSPVSFSHQASELGCFCIMWLDPPTYQLSVSISSCLVRDGQLILIVIPQWIHPVYENRRLHILGWSLPAPEAAGMPLCAWRGLGTRGPTAWLCTKTLWQLRCSMCKGRSCGGGNQLPPLPRCTPPWTSTGRHKVFLFIHAYNDVAADAISRHMLLGAFDKGYNNVFVFLYDFARCRALAWVVNNVGRYGGNRNSIFLAGHSAGAHLLSLLLCQENPFVLLTSENELSIPTNLRKDFIKGKAATEKAHVDWWKYEGSLLS